MNFDTSLEFIKGCVTRYFRFGTIRCDAKSIITLKQFLIFWILEQNKNIAKSLMCHLINWHLVDLIDKF